MPRDYPADLHESYVEQLNAVGKSKASTNVAAAERLTGLVPNRAEIVQFVAEIMPLQVEVRDFRLVAVWAPRFHPEHGFPFSTTLVGVVAPWSSSFSEPAVMLEWWRILECGA